MTGSKQVTGSLKAREATLFKTPMSSATVQFSTSILTELQPQSCIDYFINVTMTMLLSYYYFIIKKQEGNAQMSHKKLW